jgi:small-conductance mechanosensitive channel
LVRDVQLAALAADHVPPTLTTVCGREPGISCRLVWDLSHNVRAAGVTESFLSGPIHLALKLIFVIAIALAIRAVLHRVINRVTERAAQSLLPQFRGALRPLPSGRLIPPRLIRRRGTPSAPPAATVTEAAGVVPADALAGAAAAPSAEAGTGAASAVPAANGNPTASAVLEAAGNEDTAGGSPDAGPGATLDSALDTAARAATVERAMIDERRHQRVYALGAILRSAASVTIFAIAGVVVLGDLGINLAPLLASAGVVGIAIGFGAQNLVRDYLTGIFMLLEDQYGVGDVITVANATGTVETMTLRITRLRDVNGIVWHVRNGTIDEVGNQSQGWARAIIDFPVPYTADLATIRAILAEVADAAWSDPALRVVMLEKPEVWGAQEVSSSAVTMRMVVRTAPLRQWETQRELRARVKAALDAAGIRPDPEPVQRELSAEREQREQRRRSFVDP